MGETVQKSIVECGNPLPSSTIKEAVFLQGEADSREQEISEIRAQALEPFARQIDELQAEATTSGQGKEDPRRMRRGESLGRRPLQYPGKGQDHQDHRPGSVRQGLPFGIYVPRDYSGPKGRGDAR